MRTRVRRLAGSLAIWWKFNAYARVNALFQLRCALFRLKITQKRPQRIGRLFVGAQECVCACGEFSQRVYIMVGDSLLYDDGHRAQGHPTSIRK